jgi:pyruvate-ferredoxin/flavodoxin oxidoreductase
VSGEIVRLAEERQLHWAQLRELAGVVVAEPTRARVRESLEAELEAKLAAARAEYEAKLADVEATYPTVIARRLAEGLLRASRTGQTVRDLLANLPAVPGTTSAVGNGASEVPASIEASAAASSAATAVTIQVPSPTAPSSPVASAPVAVAPAPAAVAPVAVAPVAAAPAASTPVAPALEAITIEPYIDSERCTTCNECINLNKKMFAYNADKQAYVKDPKAGTFAQLVQAAEKCPVSAIHPGTPINPKEKDLEKWLKRAQAF